MVVKKSRDLAGEDGRSYYSSNMAREYSDSAPRPSNWIEEETRKTKEEIRKWPEWMRRDIPAELYR